MDVSIIVVGYNAAGFTLGCLKSVMEGTKDHSFEVIVVDNASTDGSPDLISARYPGARLIRNGRNVGLAAATTQGLEVASGRYVITMNSDAEVVDGAIDTLVRFMDGRPEAGGATPRLLFGDLTPHWPPFGNAPTPLSEIREVMTELAGSLSSYSSRHKPGEVDLDLAREVPCIVWGSCFIVRREAMEKVGFQDPRFFLYAEDVDWSMRLRKAGWKLWYVPEARVIHHGGRSADGESARMFGIRMASTVKLIRKHYGGMAAFALRAVMTSAGAAGYVKWLLLGGLGKARLREAAPRRRARFGAMIGAALSGPGRPGGPGEEGTCA
jgi:GT2 family glycosyltransferase